MSRFTKESIETLRQRIDLVEVVQQHVQLKKAGAAYKALCPFHDERSPSFVINKGDTHYHCFGCGAHGDAIQFLMSHLKVSFAEALEQLAERFQVVLEKVEGSGTEKKEVSRSRLKEATEAACRFYQAYLLHSQEGEEALSYLFSRGVTLEFINRFHVGLSPKHEGLFQKAMASYGFSKELLIESGLLAERSGRLREFFQERLMFPILDVTGACVGFSARKYNERTYGGKYINSKETPLFKKSRCLFGLSYCRKRIAKQKQAIVVEGGLDALRMIFHGFDVTVAAMGTAFGEEHVKELVQLGIMRVFLLLDGDAAGIEASLKVGHLFQKKGIEVFVARLGPKEDPDSLLVKQGPAAIMKALKEAGDYLSFCFEQLSKDRSMDSPAEKNRLLLETVQRIREWENPVMIHESLKKLAHLAKVPEELLGVGTITPMTIAKPKSLITSHAQKTIDPHRVLEADLLRWLILGGPSLAPLCQCNLGEEDLIVPIAKKLYSYVMKIYQDDKTLDLLLMATELDDEELQPFLSELANKKVNREKMQEGVRETLQRLKERNWMLEREKILSRLHSGQASDDEAMQLAQAFDLLKKSAPQVVMP